MSWLKKLLPSIMRTGDTDKKGVPEGLWTKCDDCHSVLYRAEVDRNLCICPKCGYHMPIGARKRLMSFLDESPRVFIAEDVRAVDHLKFKDTKKYKDRLTAAIKKTGETEALVVMHGRLCGMNCVAAAFEFGFIGGSMSSAVGERFVQAVNLAIKNAIPLVCFTASGGARMQEGIVSLMQMTKTSAALARLKEKGIPYIVVLTDPTMGGVSASLATLGDVIIAEPKALIGFAGPRVIEQTIREPLPEGFQRSEFLLKHGHIDMIVVRNELRYKIAAILAKLTHQKAPSVQAH